LAVVQTIFHSFPLISQTTTVESPSYASVVVCRLVTVWKLHPEAANTRKEIQHPFVTNATRNNAPAAILLLQLRVKFVDGAFCVFVGVFLESFEVQDRF
jgi:hypothetical protein